MIDAFKNSVFESVSCKIDDLSVIVYQERCSKVLPLVKSPMYQYLIDGNKAAYIKYHILVRERYNSKDRHNLRCFEALLAVVKERGCAGVDPLIVDKPYIIRDGQHRAATFKYLGYTDLVILRII